MNEIPARVRGTELLSPRIHRVDGEDDFRIQGSYEMIGVPIHLGNQGIRLPIYSGLCGRGVWLL